MDLMQQEFKSELSRVRCFLALANELHYGRAAQHVGTDQSTLSRKVGELEHLLKVKLFVRTNQGTSGLTQAGQVLLPRAKDVVEKLDQAVHAVREVTHGFTEQLRIGICDEAPTQALSHLLMQLRARNPKLDVQLVERPCEELIQDLQAERLDLGVTLGPVGRDRKLDAHEIWNHEAKVLLPGSHVLASKESVELRECAADRLIFGHRQCACGRRERVDEYIESLFVRLRIKEAAGAGIVRTLVSCGYGAGIMSAANTDRTDHAQLVARPLRDRELVYRTYIVHRQEEGSKFSREFIELAKALEESGA